MLELIHTSAPRGILDDRAGYTTVACSEGMPAELTAALVRGSTATTQRIAQDAQAEDHAVYRIWSVPYPKSSAVAITRIVPVAADYTGRPARLAHHVILVGAEVKLDALCAILLDQTAFRDTWTDPPTYLEPRTIGPGPLTAEIQASLDALAELTDHSSPWADYLAGQAEEQKPVPCTVLVPQATRMRQLLAAVVSRASDPLALRIETSEDHLVTARPSLLLIGARSSDPSGLTVVADWTDERGIIPPPQLTVRSPRVTPQPKQPRHTALLDLHGLPQPIGSNSSAAGRLGEFADADIDARSQEFAELTLDPNTAALAGIVAYFIGVVTAGTTTIVLALLLGVFQEHP